MYFKRKLASEIEKRAKKMPIIGLLGPRQSGKTTLALEIFKNHNYVSLENFDERELALQDPKKFLQTNLNSDGLIIDEVQHVPKLLSYLQTHVDFSKKNGEIVLTGSQNLILSDSISQTLAGRIALFTLLPFSIEELKINKILPDSMEELIFKGGYPRIYSSDLEPTSWYLDYIETYVERDARQIANISNLNLFRKFIRLCAGRSGQLLNIANLANDCGIDQRTAKSWISILEASYIIFKLEPHFENFNKRLIKTPKLYFYDTGLLCSLLGIRSLDQVETHYMRGALFETLIISNIFKHEFNLGLRPQNIYFWQNQSGKEIDALFLKENDWIPLEIKAGSTISQDYFRNIKYWQELNSEQKLGYVVYSGDKNQFWPNVDIVSWKNLEDIFKN